jgi:hypothetical protein
MDVTAMHFMETELNFNDVMIASHPEKVPGREFGRRREGRGGREGGKKGGSILPVRLKLLSRRETPPPPSLPPSLPPFLRPAPWTLPSWP